MMGFNPRPSARCGTNGYIRGMTVEVELEKKLRKAASITSTPGTITPGMFSDKRREIPSTRPAFTDTLISI